MQHGIRLRAASHKELLRLAARLLYATLSLGLIKRPNVKTYRGIEVEMCVLTSALDGGDGLASRPRRFIAG
jgi:hypothetical protein